MLALYLGYAGLALGCLQREVSACCIFSKAGACRGPAHLAGLVTVQEDMT
jgi:hypothetical protein